MVFIVVSAAAAAAVIGRVYIVQMIGFESLLCERIEGDRKRMD